MGHFDRRPERLKGRFDASRSIHGRTRTHPPVCLGVERLSFRASFAAIQLGGLTEAPVASSPWTPPASRLLATRLDDGSTIAADRKQRPRLGKHSSATDMIPCSLARTFAGGDWCRTLDPEPKYRYVGTLMQVVEGVSGWRQRGWATAQTPLLDSVHIPNDGVTSSVVVMWLDIVVTDRHRSRSTRATLEPPNHPKSTVRHVTPPFATMLLPASIRAIAPE
ncbi:hypothetical protein CCMA1212_004433 [Trichoderma ghanense]|uniref:Uncharacterized protein n=1 Tax=Trichoderma ghanense TaxID=65468 RepID=A0ABY2H657_9HYPO